MEIVSKEKYYEKVKKAKKDSYNNYLMAERNYMFCADELYDIYQEYDQLEYRFSQSKTDSVELNQQQYRLLMKLVK